MKSLQFIEVDVPVIRSTTFSRVTVGQQVSDWSLISGSNSTLLGIVDAANKP
jgi:hypothetical protein